MQHIVKRIALSPIRGMKAVASALFPKGGWGLWSVPRSAYDYARDVGDGLGSSVWVAPLRWLQRNFTESPIRLRRFQGEELVPVPKAHPMVQLVNKPNEFYSGATLRKATVASYETDGNAYWLAALNNQGRPVQLWYTPHTLVEPTRDDGSSTFIDYYQYRPGDGRTLRIAPIGFDRRNYPGIEPGWAMIHFRDGIDPENPMKGISGFRSLLREIFTDDEAANFTASLLKNMGIPGYVVSPKDDGGGLAPIGEEDVRETKEQFKAATSGDNRGEPVVMTGPADIKMLGFNPQQMNVRDLRRIPEERCTAIIGIPAIVCGLGAGLDRSTFANMAEAKDSAYEDKILPLQRDFADTLTIQLLPQFESQPEQFFVDFDNSSVRALQDDEDKVAARVTGLVNGGLITVAEARSELGYDVTPANDVYRVPMNLIEIPDGSTMDSVIMSAPTVEPAPAKQAKEGRVLSNRNAQALIAAQQVIHSLLSAAGYVDAAEAADGVGGKSLSAPARGRLILALRRDKAALEQAFAKRLMARFKQLGQQAAEVWAEIAPPIPVILEVQEPAKATDDERAAAERIAAREALTVAQMQAAKDLLDSMKINDFQENIIGGEYSAHYDQVAKRTYKTVNSTLGIELNAPNAISEQLIRTGGRRVGLVNLDAQTRASVYGAIADGAAQGWGSAKIERTIREYVEGGGRSRNVSARAMRIARTETMHAQNLSTLAVYEGSGAYNTVIAYDNLTGFDDEDCMDRDGQEYTFASAEDELALEHPNGTLGFAPGAAN